jgi:hypothetical protein
LMHPQRRNRRRHNLLRRHRHNRLRNRPHSLRR